MSKIKHKRKTGTPKPSYVERLNQKSAEEEAKKKAWTTNVYYYTQQETLDAASLTLHDVFGFGPERLKRFAEAFMAKFHEIQELNRQDADDPDRDYSRQKFEQAMYEAWGEYYEPHEKRYDAKYILEEPGKPVIDR